MKGRGARKRTPNPGFAAHFQHLVHRTGMTVNKFTEPRPGARTMSARTWYRMKKGFRPKHDELVHEIAAIFAVTVAEFLDLPAVEKTELGCIIHGSVPAGISIRGRAAEIKRLNACWKDKKVRFVCLEAEAGAGKTVLVDHWLNRIAMTQYRKNQAALRILKFSFNGVENTAVPGSSSAFFSKAYEWLGLTEANEPPERKGQKVAERILEKSTILVLDGIEQLQFPPKHDKREEISDNGLRALIRRLQELPTRSQLLCLITTRMRIRELRRFDGEGARLWSLPPLDAEAGGEILSEYTVRPRQRDLDQIIDAVRGHPLTLHLLGGCLRDRYKGDARRWRECILQEDADHGKIVQRIMREYEKGFNRPTLQLLRVLGLFHGPVPLKAVKALLQRRTILNLTDALTRLSEEQLNQIVALLERSHLLCRRRGSAGEHLDIHPLIQEHFRKRLMGRFSRAWQKGNEHLFREYLETAPPEINSRIDAWRLYSAIIHACNAKQYDKAYQLYRNRSDHGTGQSLARRLNLYADDLFALRAFFPDGNWRHPPSKLNKRQLCFLWTQMGTRMRWVGLLDECCEVMEHVIPKWKQLLKH